MTGMVGLLGSLTSVFLFFVAELISLIADYICKEGSFMGNKLCEKLTHLNYVERPVVAALEVCRVYRENLLTSL